MNRIPRKHRVPSPLKKMALRLAGVYKFFHTSFASLFGYAKRPMTCEMYYAILHNTGVSVKGRVMRIRKWRTPSVDDHPLQNLWQMLLIWATPERPNTAVAIHCGGATAIVQSDREGYFRADLDSGVFGFSPITLEIPISDDSESVRQELLNHSGPAQFVVISDIDDTVIVTDAARTFRMIATTLLGNALTRQIFAGTAELYRGLQRGTEHGNNPINYVSSSPYNLHGLLKLIFKTNQIPDGAWFLTDWGLDETKWLRESHHEHKLAAIREVLTWHPDLPVILIGDSGQADTEIYAEIVRNYPERIAEVLIRCVSTNERIEHIEQRWLEIAGESAEFFLFKDSLEAATHLEKNRWISREALGEVKRAL